MLADVGNRATRAAIHRRLTRLLVELARLLVELDGLSGEAGETDHLLTVDQVADLLRLSRSCVYKRAADWPFTRKLGPKALRFSAAGLARWCAEHPASEVEGNGR
jgi:predicted DNA-binding transcriptional regulator AlpA